MNIQIANVIKCLRLAFVSLALLSLISAAHASPYDDAVRADKPVAFYAMNEEKGATDAVATLPDKAIYSGGVTLGAAGPRPPLLAGFESNNTAAQFDGVDDQFTAEPALKDDAYSYEVWFKYNFTGRLMYIGGRGLGSNYDAVGMNGNALLFHSGNGAPAVYSEFKVSENSWHHLVFTRDGMRVIIYIDNVARISADTPASYGTSHRIVAGGRPDNGGAISATMDNLAVYNGALTPAQVTAHFAAAHASPAPRVEGTAAIPIQYTLPRDGKVSMAVYDKQGRQLRTLLAGEPQTEGKHELSWDGLNRQGEAMPAGSYNWRLLMNDGLEARYVSVIGANPPGPTGTPWIGNHLGPQFVSTNAKGEVYVASIHSEGPPNLLKLGSDNGPILWNFPSQSIGATDMAQLNDACVFLTWDDYLCRYDAANGKAIGTKVDVLWQGDVREDSETVWNLYRPGSVGYAMKIAADGSSVVIAYREHDKLRWIDPTSGKVERETAVTHPTAIAAGANGIVYAISEANVVAVATDGTVKAAIERSQLTDPRALAFDAVNSQILVADGGDDNRIHRFSIDGKPIKTYGRQGGRLSGAFVPTDFVGISSLACDNAGGFYAVEPKSVRRIVHVRADGSIAKQWLGEVPFYMVASADPLAPREVWYNASIDTMAKIDLDPDTGAWKLLETYVFASPTFGDGLFPNAFPQWRVRRHAGDPNTYLIHECPPAVMRVDVAARRLVPVALAWHKSPANMKSSALLAAMASQGLNFNDVKSDAFTWSDTNGNGELDPNEFHFGPEAALIQNGYATFDDKMNIYVGYSLPTHLEANNHYLFFDFQNSVYVKLPNLSDKPGAPVWDWSRLERSAAKMQTEALQTSTQAIRVDPQGGVTIAVRGQSGDSHGTWWPDYAISNAYLVRALPDGTTCWTVSKHRASGTSDLMRAPAMIGSPSYLPGVTHGCVIVCDHDAYGATAWTDDGLYAGFFLDRHANDQPNWCYVPGGHYWDGLIPGDDWTAGGSCNDLPDGSVMWFPPAGAGKSLALRVRGWDNWFRSTGTIAVTEAPSAAPVNGWGLTADYFRGDKFSGTPVCHRIDPLLWFSSALNFFEINSWANGPCAEIGAKHAFSVRWTGRVTAPLSEEYSLRIYNALSPSLSQLWTDGAGAVRVWLDGILVIDRSADAPANGLSEISPLHLEAGRSYDIKIEYAFAGGEKGPEFSVCWTSYTKAWQRIPTAYLYPDTNASAPIVHLKTVNANAAEAGQKKATVRFSVDAALSKPLTVRYRLDGSADASDYQPLSGNILIPAGATSADVIVTPVDDAIIEGNETVRFALVSDPAYRGDGSPGTATITIADDDNKVTAGIVAYYPLDESEGIVLHDRIGTRDGEMQMSYSGFALAPPRWLPEAGKIGGAIEFFDSPLQGASLRLFSSANVPDPQLANVDFTVSLCVRTRQANASIARGSFEMTLKDGQLCITRGAIDLPAAGPRIDDGAWHHLAVTWDQKNHLQEMFVDGARVGKGSAAIRGAVGAIVLATGDTPQEMRYLGKVDDLRIYNRCLDPRELETLAKLSTPLPKKYPIASVVASDRIPDGATYDFGGAAREGAPVDRTFTVQNVGTAPLHLIGTPTITIVGRDSTDFAIIAHPSTTIAVGESSTFTVRFSPLLIGARTAVISFDNDNPAGQAPYIFNVSGTGQ